MANVIHVYQDEEWDEYEEAYYALKLKGFSYDGKLICPPDGWVWNDSNRHLRDKAYKLIDERGFQMGVL